MNYPENLLYSKEHEWVDAKGDTAVIGISWFAQVLSATWYMLRRPQSARNSSRWRNSAWSNP